MHTRRSTSTDCSAAITCAKTHVRFKVSEEDVHHIRSMTVLDAPYSLADCLTCAISARCLSDMHHIHSVLCAPYLFDDCTIRSRSSRVVTMHTRRSTSTDCSAAITFAEKSNSNYNSTKNSVYLLFWVVVSRFVDRCRNLQHLLLSL